MVPPPPPPHPPGYRAPGLVLQPELVEELLPGGHQRHVLRHVLHQQSGVVDRVPSRAHVGPACPRYLVPEEEMLVAPVAGGELAGQHQVANVGLHTAQLLDSEQILLLQWDAALTSGASRAHTW